MLKLVDTSQKYIILGISILDKVTRSRALLDPPPPPGWCLGIYWSVPLGSCTPQSVDTAGYLLPWPCCELPPMGFSSPKVHSVGMEVGLFLSQ